MEESVKSQVNSEEDLYYFESDHLALKGNQDYSDVLKTLFLLTAQRERAIKDYSKVVEIKKQLLEDPLQAVEKLKKRKGLGIPELFTIPDLPKINFLKYDVNIPEDSLRQVYSNDLPEVPRETKVCESAVPREKRVCDNSEKKHVFSSDTFKKPWTMEEQKRLEELLRIHPPEAVEAKRFDKIAKALGTRTTKQVTSRVQKYFLKLRQSGLPVPGRLPKRDIYLKKAGHKHQRHNHYLLKPTTFFPHLCTPVTMDQADELSAPNSLSMDASQEYLNHNYLLPSQYQGTAGPVVSNNTSSTRKKDLQAQMNLLVRVRQEKVRENEDVAPQFVHIGFRCDYCNEDPIVGGRWHCADCKTDSVDFCTDCLVSQLYSENVHPLSHQILLFNSASETPVSDSDSESVSGSGKETSNIDFESSDAESDKVVTLETISQDQRQLNMSDSDEELCV